MRGLRAAVIAAAVGLAALVLGVVFLCPGPGSGPEAIAYGRDTCVRCRMHLSQPGFAGELRDRRGLLTKYDDLGCLVQALVAAHREVPEAWVEDHEGGGFVPLLGASLVRAAGVSTPMGHGIVAFKNEAAARAWAAAHGGRLVTLEELLRDPTVLARAPTGSRGRE